MDGNLGAPASTVREDEGAFSGSLKPLSPCVLNDSALVAEMREAGRRFALWRRDPYAEDTPRLSTADELADALQRPCPSVLVPGRLQLIHDSLDLRRGELWADGDVHVGGDMVLLNGTLYVRGDMVLDGAATVREADVVCLGDLHVEGNAQATMDALCAETLSVAGQAKIWNPSLLYLCPLRAQEHAAVGQILLLGEHAEVYGTVVAGSFDPSSLQQRIVLTGSASVRGLVYSGATLTLHGSVQGAVYANRLLYVRNNGVLESCLRDSRVAAVDLSHMTVPLLFGPGQARRYLWIRQDRG